MNAVGKPADSGSHIIGVFEISFYFVISQQNVFKDVVSVRHIGRNPGGSQVCKLDGGSGSIGQPEQIDGISRRSTSPMCNRKLHDLLILYESFALQRKAKSKNQKIEKISLKMDNYKNCVCVFLSKGNGDVLSQRNAGRCVKIGSILNLLLQEGGVPAGGGGR